MPPTAPSPAPVVAAAPVEEARPADPVEALRLLLPPHYGFSGQVIAAEPAELWRQLTRELERLPAGAARERLLARVMPIVDGWPDAMRVATYEAERRLEAGELPGVWPLIRSLKVGGQAMRRLLERGALAQITSLELSLGDDGDCSQVLAELTMIAAAPGLDAVRSLTIALPSCAGPEVVARLAELRNFPGVRRLGLPRAIGPDNAAALARIPWLEQLEELDLSTSKPRAFGLVALGQSPHLRGLRRLRLQRSLDRLEDLRGLATRSGWEGLRALDLSYNNVDDAGLRALGGSPALRGLVELDLSRLAMDPQELASLIAGGGLPALEVLHLEGNALGDRGAALLARVRRWGGLRELWLARMAIQAEGARRLAEAKHWQHLEVLDLERNQLGVEGGKALAGAPFIVGLRHLNIARCGVDGASIGALLGELAAPERLLLAGNRIGDAGALVIASRREWGGLRELDVRDGDIGADGIVALATAPQLAGLTRLEIGGNHPDERAWRALVGSASLARFVTADWRAALALHDTSLSPADAARRIPPDFQLHLTRACAFGDCKRFTVTVDADGAFDYDRTHPNDPPHPFHARLDAERLRLILAALDRMLTGVAGIPRLPEAGCESIIADLPPVRVEVRRDGKVLEFNSEVLCNGVEGWRVMWDFAARIDALLGDMPRPPAAP